MYKLLLAIALICISQHATAAYQWTENNPFGGTGVGIEVVYPQLDTKQIVIKGNDGNFYYYQWDINEPEMPGDAKTILAVLLTALATGKHVSLYHDPTVTSNGRINFTLLTLLQ